MLLIYSMAMILAMAPVALFIATVSTRLGYEPYLEK